MIDNNIPLDVNIIISDKDGNPMIELRRSVQDKEIMKIIIQNAYHETPIVIVPRFNNRLRSLSTLMEKGIIRRDGEQYFFNI